MLSRKPSIFYVMSGVPSRTFPFSTDPEVLLLIEARHPAGNDSEWAWHAAALRFSDRDLTITRNQNPVWSSLSDPSRRATR